MITQANGWRYKSSTLTTPAVQVVRPQVQKTPGPPKPTRITRVILHPDGPHHVTLRHRGWECQRLATDW